jgi:hypothetical protein
MNTYEQIVRELAEDDPYFWGGELCDTCVHCEQIKPSPHSPDCLWLRAKQAVVNPPETVEIHRTDNEGNKQVITVRKGKRTLDEVRKK